MIHENQMISSKVQNPMKTHHWNRNGDKIINNHRINDDSVNILSKLL